MSSLFANPNVSEEFDKAFKENASGKIRPDESYMSVDEENYAEYSAERHARYVAGLGKTAEDLNQMVADPRYQSQLTDYQRQKEQYEKDNRFGRFAPNESELQRLLSEGHPEEEVARLRTVPEEQRGPAPVAPVERKARWELRNEFNIPYSGITNPNVMSEVDMAVFQNEFISAAANPAELTGIMANPKSRKLLGFNKEYKLAEPRARSFAERAYSSLTKGFHRLNSMAIGTRYEISKTLSLQGIAQNGLSDWFLQSAQINAAYLDGALEGENVDAQTGESFEGPESDTLIEKAVFAALEAAPELVVTLGAAMVGAGGAATAGRLSMAARSNIVTTRGMTAIRSAVNKGRARKFVAFSSAQVYANQTTEGISYYLNKKKMTPAQALPLITGEALAAALATAVTQKVSADFLFANKPMQELAKSGWTKVMQNYMIGFASEGLQESAEQVLADAALASIAGIRGDEEKLARVGFLREGYMYDIAVAGLAGGFLGGPIGVVGRRNISTDESLTPEEDQWTPKEVENYWNARQRQTNLRMEDEKARQTALAKRKVADLSKLSEADLVYALMYGLADEKSSMIFVGKNEDRFRVTPLIAALELERRGNENVNIDSAFLQDYLAGPRSLRQISQEDLDSAATEDSEVYYEREDGKRARLTPGAAKRESARREEAQGAETGSPAPLTLREQNQYESEILNGEPSEEALMALIMASPELAIAAVERGGISRKDLDKMLGRMTGDSRARRASNTTRTKLFKLLQRNKDKIAKEVANRTKKETVVEGYQSVSLTKAETKFFSELSEDTNNEIFEDFGMRFDPESNTLFFESPEGYQKFVNTLKSEPTKGWLGRLPPSMYGGQAQTSFEVRTPAVTRQKSTPTTRQTVPRGMKDPQTVYREPGGRFTSAPQQNRDAKGRILPKSERGLMSPLEREGQAKRQSAEEMNPERVSLSEADRRLIDSALDAELEQNDVDLLRDTSMSNREVARRLPTNISYNKRLARVRELRMRRGIANAITDSRASATSMEARPPTAKQAKAETQQQELDTAQKARDTKEAEETGVLAGDEQVDKAEETQEKIDDEVFLEEGLEDADPLLSDVRAKEAAAKETATTEEIGAENEIVEGSEVAKENSKQIKEIADENKDYLDTMAENEGRNIAKEPEDDTEDDIFVEPVRGKGIGFVRAWIMTPLHFTATKAGINSLPHRIVQRLISLDIQQTMANNKEIKESKAVFQKMPEDWRKGTKFAQAMDQYVPLLEENTVLDSDQEITIDGEKVKIGDLPKEVQAALLRFRKKSEENRLQAIDDKRALATKMFSGMTSDELIKASAQGENPSQPGLTKTKVGRSTQFVADETVFSKEEIVEKLVYNRIPDDWGYQYSHFHHVWFGKYKLRAYDKDGNSLYVEGEANTEAEAYQILSDFKKSSAGQEAVRFEAKPAYNEDPDFLAMSAQERNALKKALKSETEATSEQINDGLLKARVKLNTSKSPFFSAMLERTGQKGYSMDFPKVWTLYTRQHNRFKYGRLMIQKAQKDIDALKKNGDPFGMYLEKVLGRTLFVKQSAFEKGIDGWIFSLTRPIPGMNVGPMPSRRFFAAVRSFNYLRQLKTPKQWLVNSTQPLQTVYPVVGAKTFAEATGLYNTAEGQALLDKHGRLSSTSGMYIDGTETTMGQKAIDGVTKAQELADKHVLRGKISTQSELRNMDFSFVAFYLHGKKMGLNDADAADYARVQGYVGSQFVFTRSNLPPILHDPFASTLLQYKRFQINMVGFALTLKKDKNYSGLGRWLAVNAAVGGTKGLLFTALPVYYFGSKVLQTLGITDEDEDAKVKAARMHRWFIKNLGETNANALTFGLPAYAGIDLSGSTGLFHDGFGDSMADVVWNKAKGPSVSFVTDMLSVFDTSGQAKSLSFSQRAYTKFKDTSPAAKWLLKNVEYLSGYEDEYDSKGKLRFRDEDKGFGLWMELAGGFRTVPQAVLSNEYALLMSMQTIEDKYKDRAAVFLSDGDYESAIGVVRQFNGLYPDMAFSLQALTRRFETKRSDQIKNALERYQDTASIAARQAFNKGKQ